MIATTISNSISEKPACARRKDLLRFIKFQTPSWIKRSRSSEYFNSSVETMDCRAGSKYYYKGGGARNSHSLSPSFARLRNQSQILRVHPQRERQGQDRKDYPG